MRIRIDHRRAQQAFIARGLASRDEAKRTGEYFAADEFLLELDEMLARAIPVLHVSYRVRYTRAPRDDLLLERDPQATIVAREASWEFPFSCRKAAPSNPFLREIVIPFGAAAVSPCSK